ncbi:hypothetical protein SAMN04487968_104152 [Nocardioides terrae]|uniref:Uncharacterized protein n=1 Tax=Nocardioides terrae TaxID=574651 RepID=A0A1I1H8G9_9ACTN|nr:hypothetical protein [Nocardioides terrae]SFC17773.1 hypothetical protein SAMN04487968_104152 [Nocardioides terrae]
MYDDYDDYDDYGGREAAGASSWYGDRRPDREEVVHLCPECRDLMGAVVGYARSLPEPRREPDWSRALRWLDSVCGGRDAVLGLDTVPLADDGLELPDGLPPGHRQRLESCLVLLDATARQFFDEETGIALRRGLVRLHERAPGVVTGTRSASLLTLGVVWAVGHANGQLFPRGVVTEKELKPYLNATQGGSTIGAKVRDALAGPFGWSPVDRPWSYGGQSRDLLPLGHADLLVSSVRRQLLGVRERALAAQVREEVA